MELQKQGIKVIVRVRPINKKEKETIDTYQSFCKGKKKMNNKNKVSSSALNFFTKYHNINPYQVINVTSNCVSVCDQEYKNVQRKMKDYCFYEVYGQDIKNQCIFKKTIENELQGVLQGVNCTLMAYGITGSGKTFSVFGQKSQKGLAILSFEHLFQRKRELQSMGATVQFKFSFIQIYNQNIRDLLSQDSRKTLSIGQQKGTVTLIDSTEVQTHSVQHINQLICIGTAKRTSATTQSNLISSRSHAILKLSVETIYRGNHTSSKLYIIDLAGSQKLSIQSGLRRNQGSNINKSLLTLGNCINGLVQNAKRPGSAHVPYRDSKLTRLLKDSLGGSARTIMIACISAYPFTLDETITTLNYAQRAQGIKKEVSKNIKQVQFSCPRCKQLMNSMSPQKIGIQPIQDISLWHSPPKIEALQQTGIFSQICQKLYQDILQNARQGEQIQRLRADIEQPCEEFNLILKDNEQQRAQLKDVLFNLLYQKQKIVVKDIDNRVCSDKKKIRLSSSNRRAKEKNNEKEEQENYQECSRKDQNLQIQQKLNEFQVELNTPEHFSQVQPLGQKNENLEHQRTGSKRKRNKFQVVPRPSSIKKSSTQAQLNESYNYPLES